MEREAAEKIAEETRKTYDTVAGEFSRTRSTFWDELVFLSDHTKEGDRVLDIGCGNGRLFPLIKKGTAHYTGIDYSEGLIREAKHLHPDGKFVVGDATKLPFADNIFDIAYSFAVIHHIPSKKLRAQFIHEAARVLKPRGMLILTTWYLWQPKHLFKLLLCMNPFSSLDAGDLMLTFGKNSNVRYLHAFTERELSALLTKNGFTVTSIDIIAHGSREKNIVVVAQKN